VLAPGSSLVYGVLASGVAAALAGAIAISAA
jgi:hypothetical protein